MIQSDTLPRISLEAPVLDAEQVMKRAEEATAAAVKYFGISSDWHISVQAHGEFGNTETASVQMDQSYLSAVIRLDLAHMRQRPEHIWGDIGHEVAHLVTAEMAGVRDRLDVLASGPLRQLYTESLERATVRLQRMFERDCPDPHAEARP